MGVFDSINGELVKCFPKVSLGDGIVYCEDNLTCYNTGDEAPYKRPHYNYGKNFIVLDLNRHTNVDCVNYDYILHVIVDGKVKNTLEDEFGGIDWSINETVVDYNGDLLNIKNAEDLLNYIKEQRECWATYDEINSHWHGSFDESMQYYSGFASLEDGSTEKKFRLQKIEEIGKLMGKEKDRIRPEVDILNKSISKWFVDVSDIYDLKALGGYISVYNSHSEEREICKEEIEKRLSSDDTLYERYVNWQGSDEYIKEFKL